MEKVAMRGDLKRRFWNKAKILSDDECWIWTDFILPSGYGQFRIGDKKYRAHRVAWEYTYGEIEEGKLVLHKCDNKRCVNPNHLYIGTHCDNMIDIVDRGISKGGPGLGSTRLYSGEIWLIRKLMTPLVGNQRYNAKYKFTLTFVSKMFRVSRSTVLNILKSAEYKCREGYYC